MNGRTAIEGLSGRGGGAATEAPAPVVDAVGAHGPLDVLEAQVAERREAAVELALKVVVGRARDHHGAGISDALEAGGDVDAVAVEVAVLLADHIAEIDADAEAHAALPRGVSASRSAKARWIAIAEVTALTTLANSHSMPSPVSLTIRP